MNNTNDRKKQRLLQAAAKGMRAHIVPGLVLQAFALSIALAYYFTGFTKNFFEHIALFKTEYGFVFSAISTAVFGGLIPFFYLLATKQIPKKSIYKELLFFLLLWAWKWPLFTGCRASSSVMIPVLP
jgi:hypothetical protein